MIIDEMIEFYRKICKITQAEVERVLEMSPMALAQVWNSMNPSNAAQVTGFYSTVDYTAELLRYHNLDSRRDKDLDIVIEVRAKNREARVLDFGCGTGVIGLMLKDAMPRLAVELYDLCSPAFEFAKSFNVSRKRPVDFINSFDIQHRTYDFIICNDVLEHIPDDLLEETIDLIQSRLATPYGKIFAQTGFYYEPHLIPMHFDWSEKRCNILRKAMRWEFWDVNHDFLNLVLKGNLRDLTRTASANLGVATPVHAEKQSGEPSPQRHQVLGPQEPARMKEGKGPTNGHLKQPDNRISMPSASAAPVHSAAAKPVEAFGRPVSSGGRVAITKKGVLYVGFPCNIKCKFCYYTYNESKEWHQLDECKRDAQLFRGKYGNRFVDITGGEPTIYPHILELLDYCNQIDIKPTLITNVQVLAKEDRVKQFKDHGIYDFLCSVHAIGDTYNEIIQSRHGWKNLTEGIENINKHGIPWRANCTMTRMNMTQLKDIAQWVKDRNCRILNFINFNPFEEWSSKMDIDFQARHSEIGPRLTEALDHCDRIGLEANVRYFPFCQMRGHEEKCINFQQLSYDPNEWDFCSWYAPETRAPADKLPDSVRAAASSEEELHHFIAQSLKKAMYVQNGACMQCSHFTICDGFTGQYHSRFGMEEAIPYEGARLSHPAIFIARRTGSVYLQGPGVAEHAQNAAQV